MLTEKARRQRDEGERLLDDARDRLPKVSQSVKTLRMYLEYLKLARRQIDLEREFGLGALRTSKPAGGGQGGEGSSTASVQPIPSGCGLEVKNMRKWNERRHFREIGLLSTKPLCRLLRRWTFAGERSRTWRMLGRHT